MALNGYSDYVTQLAGLIVVSTGDSNFTTQLPGIIDYAEQRIYRELDLIATRVTDTSSLGACVANQRLTALSTANGQFLVVEEINVITPSTGTALTGTRYQLQNTSRSFIDLCYPSNTTASSLPQFWSMANSSTIVLGPAPDAAYTLEVVGTQRPTALSSNNSSTILTKMLPDVFMAASMVYACGYLKNFGAVVDDPKMAVTWESIYQQQKGSALVEEVRKKYQGESYTSEQPSPVAGKPRS